MGDSACSKCGHPPKFKCERCLEPYCSSECQITDWQEHKGRCYKFPNLIPIHILKGKSVHSAKNDALSKRQHVGSTHSLNDSYRSNTSSVNQRAHNPIEGAKSAESFNCVKSHRILEKKDFTLMPKTNDKPNPKNASATLATSLSKDCSEKIQNWRLSYPLPCDFFDAIVQFIEESNNSKRFIWITDSKNEVPLRKLLAAINCSVNRSEPCCPDSIVPGCLVAVPLNKILYRAEVLATSPEAKRADVRLIDYGNEIRVAYNHIFPPIPIMANLNAYAVRVCIPNDCGPLQLESILTVRIVGSETTEGCVNVEFQRKDISLFVDTDVITKPHSFSFVKSLVDGQSVLLRLKDANDPDMDKVLNSAETIQYDFDSVPTDGTFVAARTERGWKRARILGHYAKENKYLVYTIDEGLTEFSLQVKRIPNSFVCTPMRVFAISTSSNEFLLCESMLKSAKKLSLEVLPTSSAAAEKNSKSRIACALLDDSRKIADVEATLFTGQFEELGLKLCYDRISEGTCVFISHVFTYKEIYVASSQTMDYPAIFMAESQQCSPFGARDILSKGDVVIVMDRNGTIYRAAIIACDNNCIKVRNVDRGSEHDVERNCLLKPTRFLQSLPVRCYLEKLMYLESIPTPIANNKALEALENCMKNYTEFYVTYSNVAEQTVDLLFQTKERQSLCKKLLPMVFEPCTETVSALRGSPTHTVSLLENHMPLTPPVTPVDVTAPFSVQPDNALKPEPYMLDDLEVIPIGCGEKTSLYVLDATTLLNIQSPYVTAADYDNKQFLAKMEKYLSSVSAYCTGPSSPKDGYAPRKMELCLAVFSDDGEWYRAVCIDIHPNDNFVVMFLDYGNLSKVCRKDIMPITNELMFPSNANMIYIEDITTKEQAVRFAKAIHSNPLITAKVTKLDDNDAYTAKVDQIEKLIF